ncbi:MAG: ABC transporter substrate-binding protein [Thermoanaerobaculia bacterium]
MSLKPILLNRLLWAVSAGFVAFFLTLALLTDLWSREALHAVLAAVVGCTVAIVLRFVFSREAMTLSGGSPSKVLSKITAGDLSLSSSEITRTVVQPEMAAAIRGLVLNLERTISRFGQLSADVSNVSGQINERAKSLAKISAEQLRSAESTSGSVTEIDRSINSVQKSMENLSMNAEETSASVLQMSASIEEVSRITDRLAEFVEQAASAVNEMIASINEVAVNTESFSSFATQTASSMVQMNATTVEIGRSARQSTEFADSVREAAIEGRQAVKSTVEGMRNINDTVQGSKLSLNQLVERSQEIGEIVRVIDEIAGQTNLLALNAAIIAAQAGERGKGFAVVADEIRDLSERTSVSTEEIRTLILNVQRGVEEAMAQMESTGERVGEGVSLTARAERVLEKILDLTQRSSESIAEIARATEEQIRGSQAATQAIEEVTKMVQQTASATQEQSKTSTKIGEQVATVRDYTNHLRRAMEEQESGSRSIGQAMENIMTAVSTVVESTSILSTESGSIVQSAKAVERGTREANLSVSDLTVMANTLRHESSLLSQQLERFTLATPAKGGSLTTAIVMPSRFTLDPAYCQFMALGYMERAVHETLVTFGEGAEIVPALATRWEILEHGTLYRFHLRRGVTFHNGNQFTSRDVVGTFNRLMWQEINSPGKWIMLSVVGSDDVMSGKSRAASGLVAVDEHTVEIHLKEPLAFFVHLLSMAEAAIVPIDEAKDKETFGLRGAGTGPFAIEEVRPGEMLSLRASRSYFHRGAPLLDSLKFRLDLKSARDVGNAFLRGELDIAHGLPLAVVSEMRQDSRYAPYLIDNVQLHTSYLTYDCSHGPFSHVEVRQAVSHAINKERINEKVFSGLGIPAQSVLPPGLLGYEPDLRGYAYDPEKARDLLRRAGYASGFRVRYFRWETDEFYNSGMLPMMIEDFAEIGIKVEVSEHSVEEARKARERRGHDLLTCGNWYADFPDSDNFFYIFFHSASRTILGMNYPEGKWDGLIEEGRTTNDLDRRIEIYRQLNRRSLEDAPMAYLFHDRLFVAHKPEVRGLRTHLVPPPVRYHSIWIER